MKTEHALTAALAVACLAVGFAIPAQASVILQDLNSKAEVDLTSGAGVYSWTVDGIENLRQQWFWYRVGTVGPELPLDTIGQPVVKTSDGDWDPGDERVIARYANPTGGGLVVTIDYILTGGPVGSGASDMAGHQSLPCGSPCISSC